MKKRNKAGFTRTELIVVCAVLSLLVVVFYGMVWCSHAMSGVGATAMKNKGRSIWIAVVTANSEREPIGLSAVWPKELGFDASHTSTEYFRLLMSDDPAALTNGYHLPICEDLRPEFFGGSCSGVPLATTNTTFTSKNNAWQALCVSTQTPPEVAFLVTRNVEMGKRVNELSSLKFNRHALDQNLRHRCIYVTCGGACIDMRENWINMPAGHANILEAMGTNKTYDVMYP
jgi:hypothetical protein